MKEFKPQVLTFKSNTVKDGLDKVAKNVLVHIKANKQVYIQIGKVGLYATITVTGLLVAINVQNYFQLISSYKIPMQKEKTLTQILV